MSTSGRVDHLDGIRALAIAGVLGTHWVDNYLPFGSGGHIGVDLFFVLSGFIITTILWRPVVERSLPATVWRFLRRRVRRLYPALVGLVVGCVALAAVAPIGPYDAPDVAAQGLLVLAQVSWWDLSHGRFVTVFGHTWSLGVEWAFYLVWPWVLLAMRRRGAAPRSAAGVAVALALMLYAGSFAVDTYWFTYSPLGRTAGIVAGAALALWVADDRHRRAGPRVAGGALDAVAALVVVVYGGYVLVGYPTFDPGVRSIGVPLAVASGLFLTWFGYVREAGPVRALLTWGPVTLLGRASYSLYLWHIPPLLILDKDVIALPTPVLGLIGLTFAVVATTLSYLLLERPFTSSRAGVLSGVLGHRGGAPAEGVEQGDREPVRRRRASPR